MNSKKHHFGNSKHNVKKDDDSSRLPLDMVKSTGYTLLIGILTLLVCSLLAYFREDPNAWVQPLGILCCVVTALGGGFAAIRIHRHSALLCGLLNGCILLAFMLLLSPTFKAFSSQYSLILCLLFHIAVPLLSILGAFLGIPRKRSVKKHKKR